VYTGFQERGGIKVKETILYTISGCHRCQRAKEYLRSQHIDFQEINIIENPEFLTDLKLFAGEINTPAFYIDGKVYTGNNIFNISNHS
jgi:glutaredoxin